MTSRFFILVLNIIATATNLEPYYIIDKIIDKLNGHHESKQIVSLETILAERLKCCEKSKPRALKIYCEFCAEDYHATCFNISRKMLHEIGDHPWYCSLTPECKEKAQATSNSFAFSLAQLKTTEFVE